MRTIGFVTEAKRAMRRYLQFEAVQKRSRDMQGCGARHDRHLQTAFYGRRCMVPSIRAPRRGAKAAYGRR